MKQGERERENEKPPLAVDRKGNIKHEHRIDMNTY